MSNVSLDEFIRKTYTADPTGAVRFANDSYQLVHVTRRCWRGYKTMNDAVVALDGKSVDARATTKPRWKLMPDRMKDEFATLDNGIDQLVATYCISGKNTADGTPVLTGGGNYAVLADNWPHVRRLLKRYQKVWSETADKWCTDDGYERLHEHLKEQIGEDDYARAKDLIPKQQDLRAKFGLIVREIPVRIRDERDVTEDVQSDRMEAFAELIASSVRIPREEAAEAWRNLANQLVTANAAGELVAFRRLVQRDGTPTDRGRSVGGPAILAARRATDATARCGRAVDLAFQEMIRLVSMALPDESGAARAVALGLNSDDAAAVSIGKLLLEAAAVAVDEGSMCNAVAAAMAGNRKAG